MVERITEAQADRAAKHLRETLQAGKRLTPWEQTPKSTKKKWHALALGALTVALSTEPGEAEGMVLVPREPTPEMLGAWYRYKNGHHWPGEPPPRDTSDVGAYAAMLAAAPTSEGSHHG